MRARPKSRILTWPLGWSWMFPGFRSRWTTPVRVGEGEPVADLLHHRELPAEVRRGPAADRLAQVAALEELHRHVGEAVLLAEVEDGDDVRVVELRRGLGLALEARRKSGSSARARRDRLEGHVAVQERVVGLVDLAHRALADLPDDPVLADVGRGPSTARPPGTPGAGARADSSLVRRMSAESYHASLKGSALLEGGPSGRLARTGSGPRETAEQPSLAGRPAGPARPASRAPTPSAKAGRREPPARSAAAPGLGRQPAGLLRSRPETRPGGRRPPSRPRGAPGSTFISSNAALATPPRACLPQRRQRPPRHGRGRRAPRSSTCRAAGVLRVQLERPLGLPRRLREVARVELAPGQFHLGVDHGRSEVRDLGRRRAAIRGGRRPTRAAPTSRRRPPAARPGRRAIRSPHLRAAGTAAAAASRSGPPPSAPPT